jgi:3-dehydroquinate dehydratase
MMPPRNIFAHTEPGASFPAYVSLNDVDGEVLLTVRTRGEGGRNVGCAALTVEQLEELATAIDNYLRADE